MKETLKRYKKALERIAVYSTVPQNNPIHKIALEALYPKAYKESNDEI